MGIFYDKPPAVSDGDIAYAKDVNDINNSTDTGFSLVEAAIADLPITAQAWADAAEAWSETAEDVQVEPGKYSAKHWAAKANASAVSAASSAASASSNVSSASASATSASSSAVSATSSASSATSSATAAATSETNAGTKATLASNYANAAEDVQVEPGKYSAYHWSKKVQGYASTYIAGITGTGVSNTDPRNPVITITKTTVGLGNVDNTTDAGKPVSTATASALALKADASTTNTALALKADVDATTTALALKASLASMASSLGTNGYQKFPSGVVIQWGTVTTGSSIGVAAAITFPIAFTTVYQVTTAQFTPGLVGSSIGPTWNDSLTTTGFNTRTNSGNIIVRWIAIGYITPA